MFLHQAELVRRKVLSRELSAVLLVCFFAKERQSVIQFKERARFSYLYNFKVKKSLPPRTRKECQSNQLAIQLGWS